MRPLNISASQAEKYYYQKDPIFTHNSKWHGSLAEKFKLKGEVLQKDFANIIAGNNLKGNQIIQDGTSKDGKAEHRAGIDIPLSAPKSVSILGIHADDKRLINAHEKAVEATIKYVEDNYLYARKTKNYITKKILTGQSLVATFQHSISRSNDPQLHSHCLILNMTELDGKYRATCNDLIFRDQRLINNIYQSELSKNVYDLGYDIEKKEDGKWEIAGIKKEWIDTFSKRVKEIDKAEESLKEQLPDASDAVLRNKAVLESRSNKSKITEKELRALWEKQVKKKDIKKAVVKSLDRAPKSPDNAVKTAQLAYKIIHDSESAFSKKQLLDVSLRLSRGKFLWHNIYSAFENLRKSNEIIYINEIEGKEGVPESYFTSKEMKQLEQSIVEDFLKAQNTYESLADKKIVVKKIGKNFSFFTKGQKQAVEHVLTSKDKFILIQGDSGTGKTTCLKAIKTILETQNNKIPLRGLAYTGKAQKELQEKASITAGTIHKFLLADNEKQRGGIWIVDEASMVGSVQTRDLMDRAKNEDARIVFIGDKHQLKSIQAGKPFEDLQKVNGTKVIRLNQVLRQKTDHMKNIVDNIKKYQNRDDFNGITDSFRTLKSTGNAIQLKNAQNRLQKIQKDYLKSNADTLVLTPKNDERTKLNEAIRKSLQEQKLIGKENLEVTIKSPQPLMGVKRFFAGNYDVGQTAFVYAPKGSHLNGKEVVIIGRNLENNSIQVKTPNGKESIINLKAEKNVRINPYAPEERQISTGDQIVFLKNEKSLNVQNGLKGSVEQINKNGEIKVHINENQTVNFNFKQFAYFDHGYALSIHKSQGQTAKETLYLANSKNSPMNKSNFLYVSASRAENNVRVYTDDLPKIKEQFLENQEKTSTLIFNKKSAGFIKKDLPWIKEIPRKNSNNHKDGFHHIRTLLKARTEKQIEVEIER